MTISQETCLLRVHTSNLRGIGGGMLTKQNVLFVTVRQTTKTNEWKRIRYRAKSLHMVQCLMFFDE